jgi:hypothetical protein
MDDVIINTSVNASNESQEEFDDGRSYNLDAVKVISQEWLENALKLRYYQHYL